MINKEQLEKLQNWVRQELPGAPGRIKKAEAKKVMDYLASIGCTATKDNALSHVRAFRLFPNDTIAQHRLHVDSHKARARADRNPGTAEVLPKPEVQVPEETDPDLAGVVNTGKADTIIVKRIGNDVRVGIWGDIPSSEIPRIIKLTLSL